MLLLAQSPDLNEQALLIFIMLDTAPQWLKRSRQWLSLKVLIWKIGRGLWGVGGSQAARPGPFSAIPFSLCKVHSVGLGVPSPGNLGLSSLTGQSAHTGVLCVTLPHWRKEQESERSYHMPRCKLSGLYDQLQTSKAQTVPSQDSRRNNNHS